MTEGRLVWCWEDRREWTGDYSARPGLCTLPDGHEGEHDFTDEDRIAIRFIDGQVEGQ